MPGVVARHNGAMRTTEHEFEVGLRWAIAGVALIAAGFVLGALVTWAGDVSHDVRWNDAAGTMLPGMMPLWLAMNAIGGGWIGIALIPSLVVVALLVARRPWSALAFVVASVVSAGVVQVLKHLFERARPEQILVVSDFGSFPSGHTANAATMAVVAVVLLPRVWVVLLGSAWTLLMAFSRTQVHAHWLTDTIGGALVGAGAALVVMAVFVAPALRHR